MVAAAGEQAAVVKDGFGVAVVRVDLPSAPLQIRTLFVEEDQRPGFMQQMIFYLERYLIFKNCVTTWPMIVISIINNC